MAGAAMRFLCDDSWPGNIRQLPNAMERFVATVEDSLIHSSDLPREMRPPTPTQSGVLNLDAAVQEAEKSAILAALAQCDYHRERTAQVLAISVRTLRYKMNRDSLQPLARSTRTRVHRSITLLVVRISESDHRKPIQISATVLDLVLDAQAEERQIIISRGS